MLVGVLGSDADGDLAAGPLVSSDRIEGRFVRAAGHPTTTKVRYVSGAQQIMRLDVEQRFHPSEQDIETICGWLLEAIHSVSAIVLSDYAKGVLAPALIGRVVNIARARGVPVIADPKSCDIARYAGTTVLTPNAGEAAAIAGLECLYDDHHAELAAKILSARVEADAIVVTRGAHGVTVYDPGEPESPVAHVPTAALEVFDVSGAGDTLIAAFALALACGASIKTAAQIGNAAAGIAVGKRGTAVVMRVSLRPLWVARGLGKIRKSLMTNERSRLSASGARAGSRSASLMAVSIYSTRVMSNCFADPELPAIV